MIIAAWINSAARWLLGKRRRKTKRQDVRWACPIALHQKTQSTCLGYAMAHAAAAEPHPILSIDARAAEQVYRHALEREGRSSGGVTMRAALDVVVTLGWARGWRWITTESDLAHALQTAPVVVLSTWYQGMDNVDASGFIHPAGADRGYHAYLVRGYITAGGGTYIIRNSGGAHWGHGGDCYLRAADMARLFRGGCDAAQLKKG